MQPYLNCDTVRAVICDVVKHPYAVDQFQQRIIIAFKKRRLYCVLCVPVVYQLTYNT